MAEENVQTAPVTGVQENATQTVATETNGEVLQAPHIYYYSDPSATDERLHHLPIPTIMDLDDLVMDGGSGALWHWFKTEPPKDMKDPVFDTNAGKWVENDQNAQTKIITEAQNKIDELDKKTQEFNQAQQASATQTQMLTNQLGQMNAQNDTIMKTMVSMQQTMQGLTAQFLQSKSAPTPEAPKTDSQATDLNNGGNN